MGDELERAVLRVYTPEGGAARVPVVGELLVGRGEGVQLRFADDQTISPRHARFEFEDGRLTVEDLGSVNGVFIRILEPVRLLNRDRIRIGGHVFSFEFIPQEQTAKSNITKVYTDPSTQVIGTTGERARARLVVHLDSGHRGKEYFIGERAVELGRGGGTHNFMGDDQISERHARVSPLEDDGFELEDLKSETGTWRQTRGKVELAAGQEILIGRQRLEVVEG